MWVVTELFQENDARTGNLSLESGFNEVYARR